ncbi:hypothetical protein HWV62_4587 [Athelia sp. TMB]|nr:hypothetical protein HWV62_4587 [Athelia sp. TMB]
MARLVTTMTLQYLAVAVEAGSRWGRVLLIGVSLGVGNGDLPPAYCAGIAGTAGTGGDLERKAAGSTEASREVWVWNGGAAGVYHTTDPDSGSWYFAFTLLLAHENASPKLDALFILAHPPLDSACLYPPVLPMHPALVTYGFLSSFTQLLHNLWAVFFGLVTRLVLYICSVLFHGKRQPPILPTCSPFVSPSSESPSAFESGGGFKGACADSPPLPYDDIPDSQPLQPVKPIEPAPSRKRRSRRPKKLRLSLSAICEGPDDDEIEMPRSVSHPVLGSPSIYAGVLNTRHVSLRTTSTRSCYSLSSLEGSLSDILFTGALVAADTCISFNVEDDSLAGLISSDVFLPALRPPSLNTPLVSRLPLKPAHEPLHHAIAEHQEPSQDSKSSDIPSTSTLAARRGFKGAPLSLPLPSPDPLEQAKSHKMGSYWSPDTTVFVSPRSAGATFLASMLQMTGLLSPKSFGSPSSSTPPPAPSAHLDDNYTDCDPFADYGGSYYAPAPADSPETPGRSEAAREDILDISFYLTESSTARTGLGIALGGSTTSIYNLSIADVCDGFLSGGRTSTPAKPSAGPYTPRIALTPPSAPSSPTRSATEGDSPGLLRARARAPRAPVPAKPHFLLNNPALRPFLLPLHVAHRERQRGQAAAAVDMLPPARPATARGHVRGASCALVPLASPVESEAEYYTAPSSPDDGPEAGQAAAQKLETRNEQDIADAPGEDCPPVSKTASEKRRSRAVVDLISLLDAAAAGAADTLDAIRGEGPGREEVDIGEAALVHAF